MRILISFSMLVVSQISARAETLSEIAEFFASEYGSQVILPFARPSEFGKKQVGALYTERKYRRFGKKRAFDWRRTISCIEDVRRFAESGSTQSKTFLIKIDQRPRDFQRTFGLPVTLSSRVKSMRVTFSDLEASGPDDLSSLQSVLRSGWSDESYCRRYVFCGPERTYVVSKSVRAAVDVEMMFRSRTSVSLAGAAAAIVAEQLGLNDPEIPADFATSQTPTVRLDSSGTKSVVAFQMHYWRRIMPRAEFRCGSLADLR